MKQCDKCGQTKTLEEFSNTSCEKDGKQRYCKMCVSAYKKMRRANGFGISPTGLDGKFATIWS